MICPFLVQNGWGGEIGGYQGGVRGGNWTPPLIFTPLDRKDKLTDVTNTSSHIPHYVRPLQEIKEYSAYAHWFPRTVQGGAKRPDSGRSPLPPPLQHL